MPITSFEEFANCEISDLYNYKTKDKKLRSLSPDSTIPKLTGTMSTFRIRTIPVIENNSFVGIITQSDVARYLPPKVSTLPLTTLLEKGMKPSELSDSSKIFMTKTVKDAFDEVLNIKGDEKIAVIESDTSFYDAITCFTERGANNRRYRTLAIREAAQIRATLSYLDVFEILLNREYFGVIGGLLEREISQELPPKEVVILQKTDTLDRAIYTLDQNLFTHLPIGNPLTHEVIGLVDEIMVRSLQYESIYDRLAEIELSKILEVQRQNLKDVTVKPGDTIRDALTKFTQSKVRPTTLLVGDLSEDGGVVTVDNTLSYVDVMHMVIRFINVQR